jgi:hypothetical protein
MSNIYILEGFRGNPEHSSFLLTVKVFLGIALFAGSPFMAVNFVTHFNKVRSSEDWPQTVATISESKVLDTQNYSNPKIRFVPSITYTFEVGGRLYKGNRIAFTASSSSTRTGPDELTSKYPMGTQHRVYYDPSDPQNCVLEKGADWFQYFLLLIPMLFLVGGLWMTWENGGALWRRLTAKTPDG